VEGVNEDDDEAEDDDAVLAKNFAKDILSKYGKEFGRFHSKEADDDDDDVEEEVNERVADKTDDESVEEETSDLSESEEDFKSGVRVIVADDVDDDSDDDDDDDEAQPVLKAEAEEDEESAESESNSVSEEENALKESAEEVPMELMRPAARIIVVRVRENEDGLPARRIESDEDSSSAEEVEFEDRHRLRTHNYEMARFMVRGLGLITLLLLLVLLHQCCRRRTCSRGGERVVHVVPNFSAEQLGFVTRAADNLKQKVNGGGEVKYEKLPPPEFV